MKNGRFKNRYIRLILVNTYLNTKKPRNHRSNWIFARAMAEFKQNRATHFSSTTRLEAVDFSKLVVTDGCVLNALCPTPFPDIEEQDVNFIYYADNIFDFEKTVETTVDRLNKMFSANLTNRIKVEKNPGTPGYNVFLECNVQLNFS